MKLLLLLFSTIFMFPANVLAEQIVLKINVLHGDSFNTPEADVDAVRSTFKKAFLLRGDTVIEPGSLEYAYSEKLFFADVFIYQFPNDEPGMSVTIRKNDRVHFLKTEKKRIFGNEKLAFSKLAKDIVEGLPAKIPQMQEYEVEVGKLLNQEGPRIGNTRGMTKAVSSNYREKYSVSILLADAYDKAYPFEGNFSDYFPYCLNMKGFRNKLKGETLTIIITINELGLAVIEKVDTPVKLKEKYITQIHQAVASIPLLLTTGESRTATISVEVD